MRNDVIKMSSFIETELEHEVFVNGRAFYEFTKEEDLLGYKEVVHVPNKLIEHVSLLKFNDLFCSICIPYAMAVPNCWLKVNINYL